MSPIPCLNLTVLLIDGFSNLALSSLLEPLRAACHLSGKPLFSWRIVTPDGRPAVSSSGLALGADAAFGDRPSEALVVVAGYGARDGQRRKGLNLHSHCRALPLVAGIDTGAWLLAEAGLLAGRRATVHWMEADAMAEAFPEVDIHPAPHLTDGRYTTCSSADGARLWALALIEARAGQALGLAVARMFGQPEASAPLRTDPFGALPAALQRVIAMMQTHIEDRLPLAALARGAAISERTMDRLFRTHLDRSSGAFYREIRLRQARLLARETRLSLEEIAIRTGFNSATTLTRAYRTLFGETIRRAVRCQTAPPPPVW